MEKTIKDIQARLGNYTSAAVAFSGGVDSSFLLAAARGAGLEKLIAVMVVSPFVPDRETESARKVAGTLGVDLIVVEEDVLGNPDVVNNSSQRCFYCKKQIFARIKEVARKQGVEFLLHAINLDDMDDFRPGLRAAEEMGFFAPLAEAGFTKADIRRLSKEMGLETWDRPSQSCLATRIPYDTPIEREILIKIDKAESLIQDLGFEQVRVRFHGNLARIEVAPDRVHRLFEAPVRKKVSTAFKEIGFAYTSIDIDGYKTGKMNDEIL